MKRKTLTPAQARAARYEMDLPQSLRDKLFAARARRKARNGKGEK
jgi:hypothetical protein